MARSTRKFERWNPRSGSTWPFSVYQQYNAELGNILMSHFNANAYTYKKLSKEANWEDDPSQFFKMKDERQSHVFKSVKHWSENYNAFDNWNNLNAVMAASANLETYMATVINLALESDVGTLFGTSQRIDGIQIVKHSKTQPFDYADQVMSCTKGDWSSRVSAYKRIFNYVPEILEKNISKLDKFRVLRNNVGHAFGRDISESRNHEVTTITSMAKIDRDKTIKYHSLVYNVAKHIDRHLYLNHIGEYQALFFYHNLRPSLKFDDPIKDRLFGNHAAVLKKRLGTHSTRAAGKEFCKGLITYYESL